MRNLKHRQSREWFAATLMMVFLAVCATNAVAIVNQEPSSALTPLQLKIEKHRVRLSSMEQEERRDAVSQLGAMHHPDASRVAVSALKDPSPSVRATAASSVLDLPGEESAGYLLPLLSDRDEFVRREAAYALGKTRSSSGVASLIERLLSDKQDGVRGAAAVALGDIADASAVSALAAVVSSEAISTGSTGKKNSKSRKEQNPFVLRAAARSLGQIGNRNAVPALIAALQNDKTEDDVRREVAGALGLIGDPSSIPALRAAVTASDPYLSKAAHEAIQAILKLKT